MIEHKKLELLLPGFDHRRTVGRNNHPVLDPRRTRRNQNPSRVHPLNHAHPATAIRRQTVIVAQGRQPNPEFREHMDEQPVPG
jgi:hypothetical protein